MKILTSSTTLALTGALMISGCTPPGENTERGVVIGAGLGALTAIASGKDTRDVVAGAVIGGAIGGAIGNDIDRQAAELEEELSGTGATIINTGDRLIVNLPEAITFDVDSTFVRPAIQGALSDLAQSINDYPNTIIDVVGHTDSTGSASYNQNLSARRADAVAAYLTGNGVNANRLRIYGRGETSPIASNATAEGRQANRRVEVIITPIS